MTRAFPLTPAQWRVVLLCAATLVLHLLTIDWLGEHIGAGLPAQTSADDPAVISAALHLAAPPPEAPLPRPRALSRPAPPAERAGSRPSAQAQAAALAALASDDDTPSVSDTQIAAQAEADGANFPGAGALEKPAPAQPAVAAKPVVAVAEPAPPKPAADTPKVPGDDAPFVPHRYRTALPEPAEFDLDVKRVDADGTKWDGVAGMRWSSDGSHYKVSVEAGISVLVTRVNLLVLTSEGIIDEAGIAPVTATEKRKGRALTATHFNRDTKLITFSTTEGKYPLPEGAQDKASLPFQLAAIGRADVNQFSGNIDLFVGEDKEANLFRFHLVGEDELETKMGRLVTWHLTRPPRPGSYSSRLDIWLAPSLGWYPVQIRNTEASGALTTQTVTSLHVDRQAGMTRAADAIKPVDVARPVDSSGPADAAKPADADH